MNLYEVYEPFIKRLQIFCISRDVIENCNEHYPLIDGVFQFHFCKYTFKYFLNIYFNYMVFIDL